MDKLDRKTLRRLQLLLVLLHIVFDAYFFLFVIPTNFLFPDYFWTINLFFVVAVAGFNVLYGLHCPLTVWNNDISKRLDPEYKASNSALADLFVWAGITKQKLSLAAINTLVGIYLFFMIVSFIVTRV